jgi:hypothetical protein
VQINNTWELSAVPYLPVMNLVAAHCDHLSRAGVNGLMLSWSLGGYPSPNLQIAKRVMELPNIRQDQILADLALQRYGRGGIADRDGFDAWRCFSEAFETYPFNVTVVYRCPVQFGPANLLWAKPTGYKSTMIGFPYDDLTGWRGPYPSHIFAGQFEKLSLEWKAGLRLLEQVVRRAPPARQSDAKADLRYAKAAYCHFQSTANQVRFVMARDALAKPDASATAQKILQQQLRQVLSDEVELARDLLALTCEDSRIGFEASNDYYYLPQDLVEKMLNCRYLAGDRGGLLK